MSLKHSYTFIAPIYDLFVSGTFDSQRRKSLKSLRKLDLANSRVLISGIGTGLDLPFLPEGPVYTGIDLTAAMLKRAHLRNSTTNVKLQTGDVMSLPFEDNSFDAVIMHLILAVVPKPHLALQETQRVLKPGGYALVLDKFLRPGETAPLRRLINPIISRLATQTNVVFENVLSTCPQLNLVEDESAMAGGWFRRIVLQKS